MIFALRRASNNNKQILDNAINEARELFKSGDVQIDVKSYRSKRSLNQNAYFWKLATLLGDYLGYEKDDIKDYFMIELGHFKESEINGRNRVIPYSTTRLKVDEFSVLIQCVIDKLIENKIEYPQPSYFGFEI